MASVINVFLFGGISLQQYLSEFFQPGLLPTECMHPIARTGANYFFLAGERGKKVKGLSLCMTCDVCYLLLGVNEGLGEKGGTLFPTH